jgi:hypothetical protein
MPPSEQLLDAMCDSSSLVIMCEYCGRTYFGSPSQGDYNEGEYDDLVKRAEEEPDKYVETYDFTRWGYIDGKQAVIECVCGLKEVMKWEKWILRHRYLIADYLDYRATAQSRAAERTRETADKIVKAVRTIDGMAVRPGEFPAKRTLDI